MDNTTEERELKCVLTDDEVQAYSKEMAKKVQDRTQCDDEKKSVTSEFNDRIKHLDTDINGLARKVSNGYEHRPIVCDWTFGWEEGKKYLYRTDSGELVDTQGISEYERQQHLELA